MGWLGRDMASDCLPPDGGRIWLPVKLPVEVEFWRFIVELGCGRAEFRLLSPPSVCAQTSQLNAPNAKNRIAQMRRPMPRCGQREPFAYLSGSADAPQTSIL